MIFKTNHFLYVKRVMEEPNFSSTSTPIFLFKKALITVELSNQRRRGGKLENSSWSIVSLWWIISKVCHHSSPFKCFTWYIRKLKSREQSLFSLLNRSITQATHKETIAGRKKALTVFFKKNFGDATWRK